MRYDPCVDEKVRAEGLRPKGILGGVDGPANLGDVGVFLERPHEGRDLEDVAADETLYWSTRKAAFDGLASNRVVTSSSGG